MKIPMFKKTEDLIYNTLEDISREYNIYKGFLGYLVQKEIIDNALDSVEELGILGKEGVEKEIDEKNKIIKVKDKGKGIPYVEKVFNIRDVSRKSTKFLLLPRRGCLGAGLKFVLYTVLADDGEIEVTTKGKKYKFDKEKKKLVKIKDEPSQQGTEITIKLNSLKISKKYAEDLFLLSRGEFYKGKSSPWWYTGTNFQTLCKSCPEGYTIEKFVRLFEINRDFYSSNIFMDYKNKEVKKLTPEEAIDLLKIMRDFSDQISPEKLGKVGNLESEKYIYFGKPIMNTLEIKDSNSDISAHIPYVIEIWIKERKNFTNFCDLLHIYINRTKPIFDTILFYDEQFAFKLDNRKNIEKDIQDLFYISGLISSKNKINKKIYLEGKDKEIIINVIIPYINFKSTSKIPDLSGIFHTILENLETFTKNLYFKKDDNYSVKKKKYNWINTENLLKFNKKHPQENLNIQKTEQELLEAINNIIKEHHEKWGGISVRRLYYVLASERIIEPSNKSYKNLDKFLSKYRDNGDINSDYFIDYTRQFFPITVVSKRTEPLLYLKERLNSIQEPILDIWEDTDYYFEVWVEKEGITPLFEQIKYEYQISVFPIRGYPSYTWLKDSIYRFKEKINNGKQVILLYFGDLDPSGWHIFEHIKNKLNKKLNIEIKRVLINPEQIKSLNLIPIPGKEKDPRSKNFEKLQQQKQFEGCYELDAVSPEKIFEFLEIELKKYFPDFEEYYLIQREKIKNWVQKFDNYKQKIIELFETNF